MPVSPSQHAPSHHTIPTLTAISRGGTLAVHLCRCTVKMQGSRTCPELVSGAQTPPNKIGEVHKSRYRRGTGTNAFKLGFRLSPHQRQNDFRRVHFLQFCKYLQAAPKPPHCTTL